MKADRDRCGAVVHPELVIDAVQVVLHGPFRNPQPGGDFFTAFTLRHPLQHFPLSFSQLESAAGFIRWVDRRGNGASGLFNSLPAVSQVLFQNGHVALYSNDVPRTMAGLFELVSKGNLELDGMTICQATLEDVFLKLTGRRIRE